MAAQKRESLPGGKPAPEESLEQVEPSDPKTRAPPDDKSDVPEKKTKNNDDSTDAQRTLAKSRQFCQRGLDSTEPKDIWVPNSVSH